MATVIRLSRAMQYCAAHKLSILRALARLAGTCTRTWDDLFLPKHPGQARSESTGRAADFTPGCPRCGPFIVGRVGSEDHEKRQRTAENDMYLLRHAHQSLAILRRQTDRVLAFKYPHQCRREENEQRPWNHLRRCSGDELTRTADRRRRSGDGVVAELRVLSLQQISYCREAPLHLYMYSTPPSQRQPAMRSGGSRDQTPWSEAFAHS